MSAFGRCQLIYDAEQLQLTEANAHLFRDLAASRRSDPLPEIDLTAW